MKTEKLNVGYNGEYYSLNREYNLTNFERLVNSVIYHFDVSPQNAFELVYSPEAEEQLWGVGGEGFIALEKIVALQNKIADIRSTVETTIGKFDRQYRQK